AVGEKSGTGARRAGKPGGSDRAESGETWIRFDEADTGGARRTTGSAGARPSGVVSSPVSRSGVGGAGGLHPLRRHAGAHHPVLGHQRVHRHRPHHGHPAPAGEPAVRRAGPGLGAAARAHGSLRRGPDQPLQRHHERAGARLLVPGHAPHRGGHGGGPGGAAESGPRRLALVAGIPHPPGNPLFVVLARAWELLLAPTGLSVAVRINLFSATMSALAHGFWFLVMHRIAAFMTENRTVRLIAASAAVLV